MTSYYREGDERARQVRRLFSRIARRYDLINDLQSAGMHRLWKERLVSEIQPSRGMKILDLACGSGDLAFRVLDHEPGAVVIGGDFTLPMLGVAQERALGRTGSPAGWVNLDGLALPFASGTFDAVMMAYGLRNMADPLLALREIARVMKPGGRMAILDFGKPSDLLVRTLFYGFLRTVQPALGRLFFGDADTYRYIYESLMKYPAQEGVLRLLGEAGFGDAKCFDLALGTMSLHVAVKGNQTMPPS